MRADVDKHLREYVSVSDSVDERVRCVDRVLRQEWRLESRQESRQEMESRLES